jgi:drug/metabolite transporter (DMT)-like permease
MPSSDRPAAGYLFALLSAAAGAVRYNLAVFAAVHGLQYVPFLAGSLAVGMLCCLLHVALRDGVSGMHPLRAHWRTALLYGLLLGWSTLTSFVSLRFLNETVMTSLSQTTVLVTILLAVLWLGERFSRAEWIATAVICAGIFLFRPWQAGNLEGISVLMSGVVAASIANVGAKRWVQGTPPRVLMLWRNAIALGIVATYAALLPAPRITLATALACVAAGVLGPWLHGLFFLHALERIDAAKAVLASRVQPAIVFLLSWIFLSRLPSGLEIASAALLVAGTLWLGVLRPREALPPSR